MNLLAETVGTLDFGSDVGVRMTCGEADAIGRVLAEEGHPEGAAQFLVGHALNDEPDDSHHELTQWGAPNAANESSFDEAASMAKGRQYVETEFAVPAWELSPSVERPGPAQVVTSAASSSVDWHERLAQLSPHGPSPELDRAYFGALAQSATDVGPVSSIRFQAESGSWLFESVHDASGAELARRGSNKVNSNIHDLAVLEDVLPRQVLEDLSKRVTGGRLALDVTTAREYASGANPVVQEAATPRPRTSVAGITPSSPALDSGPQL